MVGMDRRSVLVGCVAGLAGCNGLLPERPQLGDETTASRTQPSATDRSTDTPTVTSTPTTTAVDFPVSDVILAVAEVGPEYEVVGETIRSLSSASGDQRQELVDNGIRLLHERSFQRSGTAADEPQIVLCSVTVHTDESTAQQAQESLLSSIESSGGTVEDREVLSGYDSTRARFQNDRGDYNVLYIRREADVVYYVVTSDPEEYYPTVTRQLFAAMVTDAPRE
ncbi:hypothetical protein [Halobaculum sp. EA56]|uniref:hypothetical protein n=1 Tax=Halobaculum sp. EA56 TaxID=3421648 RepID=UPI003EBFFDA0